ncbi:hypothetical protein GA0070606_3739 [Micromonospora citrea]|uniref:Uncharacterized protein n=1 Tax=Micromonospora citrea TaxID=47855 RepID=A0A1C6VAL3_9ACTN|nr:hypothetical protein [Micromonospora citrea]SCL63104.1 hypothetical protein GA0070606_3739 [Micromonospora citrea]
MNAAPARVTRAALTAVTMLAASLGVVGLGATPAAAGTQDKYTVTKWSNSFDGGCVAESTVSYWPGTDTASITTTVSNPYLFAACRVNTRLYVQGTSTQWNSAVHYTMACGITDTSCSSTRTVSGTYYSATPSLTAYVDSVNDALEAMGQERSFTRKKAVESISIEFSKAA